MESRKFIISAKKVLGVSGYGLSKIIGLGSGTLTNYEKGRRVMDDYTAFQLAEILDIDPAKIIAVANMDREKDQFKKEFWQEKVKEYGFISTSYAVLLSFSSFIVGNIVYILCKIGYL